jgi:transporter family protein
VSSLSQGDASLVTPLYNFNIFFLAIGASWFLTEPLTATKVAGLGFLLVGASFLIGESSFSRSLSSLTTNGPCRQMIGASFLIAIGRIVDKAHIGELNPYIYALFLYLSISFWVGLYLLFTGRAGEISKVFKCRPALAITCGIGNGYSYICLLWALTSYNVSVVEPLSMLSVLVTLFLSKVYLGETLGHRIYGAMIMIGGAILIC